MNKLDDSDLKKDVLSRAAHINTEDRLASEDTRKEANPIQPDGQPTVLPENM